MTDKAGTTATDPVAAMLARVSASLTDARIAMQRTKLHLDDSMHVLKGSLDDVREALHQCTSAKAASRTDLPDGWQWMERRSRSRVFDSIHLFDRSTGQIILANVCSASANGEIIAVAIPRGYTIDIDLGQPVGSEFRYVPIERIRPTETDAEIVMLGRRAGDPSLTQAERQALLSVRRSLAVREGIVA